MLVGQQIGPFEIEKELGSGAMGTVYRAKFHRSEEKVVPVALKVVAMGLLGNESAMARFEREANILKQLRHPHIVRLIAHGKINRQNPYIAMEYIDGEALDRALARRGKLSWEEVLAYGKQLCDALQYAHDKGIIHRDLKPSNLMIAKDGTLKLTDFGIAKDTDVTALTGANSTIGTAAYMSPEQCKGDRNLSNKSDLYSLGVVFFELLTGRKPFVAETTVEMFLKHVNEKAPRIGKQVNELPPKFESLILQLLEKDKDNRPIDAKWVGRILQEVEDDAFARKSAGLSVANARSPKALNQSGERMDDSDKEAARALRGKRKKKKKAEQVPLLERKWVRAVGITLILAGIAGGAFFALRPASPEKMYAAIDKAETPDAKLEAATAFLEAYGARGGEAVDKAAEAFRAGQVRKREGVLANRFTSTRLNMQNPEPDDDPEAYKAAWAAMEYEKLGQLEHAKIQWEKAKARFPDEAKLPFTTKGEQLAKALWGWLAEKRLADIAAVRAELEQIRQKHVSSRLVEQPLPTDPTSPESLAVRAYRLKLFGDEERAATACDKLLELVEKDPDKHVWYLLASQLKGTLSKGGSGSRAERLRKWLDDTHRLAERFAATSDPVVSREVRNRCRDVIELYGGDDDPDVKAAVERAQKIAASVPKT